MCCLCVCGARTIVCLCLSVLSHGGQRDARCFLSPLLSALLSASGQGFHWTRSLALQPSLLAEHPWALPSLQCWSHWDVQPHSACYMGAGISSCFQSTFPPQSQVSNPKIPLVMKSTFICLSSILHKDVFFFMIRPTPLPPAPSASPPPGAAAASLYEDALSARV